MPAVPNKFCGKSRLQISNVTKFARVLEFATFAMLGLVFEISAVGTRPPEFIGFV